MTLKQAQKAAEDRYPYIETGGKGGEIYNDRVDLRREGYAQALTDQPQLSRSVLEEVLQKSLDYLHSNVTASIVYEDYHDFSKGIKGAEVDCLPETVSELLAEMKVNLDDLLPVGGGWVDVKDRLPEIQTMVLIYHTDKHIDVWYYEGVEELHYFTHWQPLPKAPNS